ncbi:orotidine 5'-phosphate decarboxylase [mine drainage metagenome]|uniref:Orotidine 5'-phosphate decarboxylase n=1 Tax=mine drainage metagenome TaxID=410659 RepID=T1A6P7_9ZZZZ
MAGAVRAVRRLGVRYLTIHAAGGRAMLAAAQAEAGEEIQLLSVTLLTSIDAEEAARIGFGDPADVVRRLSDMTIEAGVRGFITSGAEVQELHRSYPDAVSRGAGHQARGEDGTQDQQRVATPTEAVRRGASLLVVGRPITKSADPGATAAVFVQEILEGEER